MYRRYKSKLLGQAVPHGLPPRTPRQRTKTKTELFKKEPTLVRVSEDNKPFLPDHTEREQWLEMEERLLHGFVDYNYPRDDKIVRIFTSSTFTDTRHERNTLMENVYPKLKEYCKEFGLEFQVVDMRWGVRDEASNDHTTTELCMNELDACRRLSTGPYFVTFLSHKYGYRPFPRVIEASEFEEILRFIKEKEDQDLLLKWFKKDENNVPVSYILQPISTYLPDFLAKDDKEKFKAARNTWWDVNDRLTDLLATAASKALTKDNAHKFLMSVTENEITEGILKGEDTEKHCFWYNRRITDIDQQTKTQLLSKYKDAGGPDDVVKQAQDFLNVLKEERIPQKLPEQNILNYNVLWSDNGIDPEHVPAHRSYLEKLSVDFENTMKTMIQAGIQEKAPSFTNPEMEEILQHLTFCNEKCTNFHGRQNTLQTIKSYVEKRGKLGPCMLHGESGCGKTYIMAMVAKLAQSWLDDDAVVVVRFVGITQESSSIRTLLLSILEQLSLVYNVQINGPNAELGQERQLNTLSASELGERLQHFLSKGMVSMVVPLVLVVDSLDQLSPDENPASINWIPAKIARNVRIILSTLPDTDTAKYGFLPKLQDNFSSKGTFIPVPQILPDEGTDVVKRWLSVRKRNLMAPQLAVLTEAFSKCPNPLYLNLCFETAVRWTSYQSVDISSLKDTVKEAIAQIFKKVELKHGSMLTSHILANITASRNGLSEAELEDILSCDEEVLNDVYQYWTPPVRRLPPLLLVRVRTDLQQYLVERGSEGVKVIYWYHRQFVEAARQLYLPPEQTEHCQKIHKGIAEFFLGTWADTPKPFTNKQGEDFSSKRAVVAQPLHFKDVYNVRKLMEMPEHLIKAGMVEEVEQMFFNVHWIMAKIKGTSFYSLVGDIEKALELLKGNSEFDYNSTELLLKTMRLSQNALVADPDQLPGQILGRLSDGLDKLREQCLNLSSTFLLPRQPCLTGPGGELQHQISGYTEEVSGLDISSDSKFVISCCSEDLVIHIWNADTGVLVRKVDVNLSGKHTLMDCRFCCHDTKLLLNADQDEKAACRLYMMSFDTGSIAADMPKHYNWAFSLFGEGKTKAVVLYKNKVYIVDLESGEDTWGPVKDPGKGVDSTDTVVCANDQHVCFCYRTESWFKIVDVSTEAVSPRITAFRPGKKGEVADTVDTLTISPENGFLLVLGLSDQQLKMYDLKTQELIKSLEGELSIENLRLFPGNNLLVSQALETLNMRNLDNPDEITEKFHHPTVISRWACSENRSRFVTAASDNVIRIWSNELTSKSQKRKLKPAYGETVNLLPFPENDRYILAVINIKEKGTTGYWFEIHDLLNLSLVKTMKVTGDLRLRTINFVSDTHVVLAENRRVKVINLSTSKVDRVLDGVLPKRRWDLGLALNKSAVVTLSRGTRGIKVMCIQTGKVLDIIQSTLGKKLQDLIVSGDGNIVAACEEDRRNNSIVVFNLTAKQVSHTLSLRQKDCNMHLAESSLFYDGTYLINLQYGAFEDNAEDSFNLVFVWDLKSGKLVHPLYDKEAFEQHRAGQLSEEDTSPDSASSLLLQTETPVVVQAGYDNIIRIFNVIKGDLIEKFPTNQKLTVDDLLQRKPYLPNVMPKYMVSQVFLEDTFSIYDVSDWKILGSFKMDIKVKALTQVGDGSVIVGWDIKHAKPVVWYLSGERSYSLSDTAVSFEQLEDASLELSNASVAFDEGADDPEQEYTLTQI